MKGRIKRIVSYLFALIILSRLPAMLWALDPQKILTQYKLDVWQIERGFEQKSVYSILQSRDGYIWLGTLGGLVRFDGVRFKVYDKQNTEALGGNEIRSLYQDRSGVLWIGTDGGLTSFKDGTFKTHKVKGEKQIGTITSIVEDWQGTLWIGAKFVGVAYLKDGVLSFYEGGGPLQKSKVFAMLEDLKGDLWFGYSGGLARLRAKGGFVYYQKESGLDCSHVYALCERKNGELWVGTDNGLFHCTEQKDRGIRFQRYGKKEGIPDIQLVSLCEDRDGNLWGGTDGGGLIRVQEGKIETLSPLDGLASGYVYSLCEDREGSLWIGTLDGGLHRLRDTRFITYTEKEGLIDDYVVCLHEDKHKNLWIGTEDGVSCLNNGIFTRLTDVRQALADCRVTSIFEARDETIWFGYDSGLKLYKNGKLYRFPEVTNLFKHFINHIFQDRYGAIWIADKTGLKKYYNDKVTSISSIETKISCIFEDRKGTLWVGNRDGIVSHVIDGELVSFPLEKFLLDKSEIECIYEDKEGVIYIGARVGLSRVANGKVTHFNTRCGLSDNFVNSILDDDLGYLWLGCRTGIFRILKKELEDYALGKIDKIQPIAYNEEDGMKNQFCPPGGIKTWDGKLWFPTIKGLVMVNPADIRTNDLAPPVIIEDLIVDGESIVGKGSLSCGEQDNPLEIPPGKKRLEFYYTALSFIKPGDIKFKLKLEGYDRDWIEVGNTRSNTYTALSPGHYSLKVQACNSDGVWNEKGNSFSFYLKPYFYETTWFYIICTMVAILIAFLVYRVRVAQLKARERKLSRLVDVRTKELNESKQIIEEKNRNIMASIQYARKIQQAILPTDDSFRSIIEDYFILFKPRDIVSGDFYWFNHSDGKYYLAVADCTGHGVPGALLSMIGNMRLNEIIEETVTPAPARFLVELHEGVRHALRQEREESPSDDGMDIVLCMIDLKQGKVTYSGARRPLLYVKDSQFSEIKGSRDSIGGRKKSRLPVFTNYEIDIQAETVIYLTSDGFADQNNEKGKKYGSMRLKQFLQTITHLPMAQQKEALETELIAHQGDEEQRDDITIIGLKLKNT
jgi:ligand-binding sensor domain-containing protein/serine phosphatase RsbU (regulator of sigma subunit)